MGTKRLYRKMKKAEKAVVVIANAILEPISRVQVHQHIVNLSESHYNGTPKELGNPEALRVLTEAEAIFFEDPLRWLNSDNTAPIIKAHLTEPAGYALEFVRRMVSGAVRASSSRAKPAQPVSLRSLLDGQQPEVDQPMSLEQALAVPGIADYFAAACRHAREVARRIALADKLEATELAATREKAEHEEKLRSRIESNQELQREVGNLRQFKEKAERDAGLLLTAQTSCRRLEAKIAELSAVRVCSWTMLVVGILVVVVGLSISKAQFERTEAPNYAAFIAMGILFAGAITLIALPSRKLD